MNYSDPNSLPDGQAKVLFQDGGFSIIQPGSYVLCHVTGQRIALEALKYWNVDLQEAYASPAAALKRHKQNEQSGDET